MLGEPSNIICIKHGMAYRWFSRWLSSIKCENAVSHPVYVQKIIVIVAPVIILLCAYCRGNYFNRI